jgi:hypothetical protein
VIDRARRDVVPGSGKRLMARVAHIGAINVRCTLAAGVDAIMATDTVTAESGMIGRCTAAGCRYPACGGMTNVTLLSRDNMARSFTCGNDIVMAVGANIQRLTMIKRH